MPSSSPEPEVRLLSRVRYPEATIQVQADGQVRLALINGRAITAVTLPRSALQAAARGAKTVSAELAVLEIIGDAPDRATAPGVVHRAVL